MECRSCGTAVSADAKFCSRYGDEVSQVANNLTGTVGQLSPLEEQSLQLLELAAKVKDLTEVAKVRVSVLRAFNAIQDATAEANTSGDGLLAWFGFGKTGRVMTQLASELRAALGDLHSLALATGNPKAETQAKALANLIQITIEAANTVRMYYDAPYAALYVSQAIGQINAVSRELASFLK
jgi:hypothetical protein